MYQSEKIQNKNTFLSLIRARVYQFGIKTTKTGSEKWESLNTGGGGGGVDWESQRKSGGGGDSASSGWSGLHGEWVCVFTEAMFSLLSPTAQRSAQELPLVDKQSMETCPASGGETMLLEGHNFQLDSKVVFVEKAQGKKGGAVE